MLNPRRISIIFILIWSITSKVFAGDCDESFRALLQQIHQSHPNLDSRSLVKRISNNTRNQSQKNGLHFKEQIDAIEQISRRDPTFKKLVELFDQKKYSFAIDTGKEARLDILKTGFKNQHEITNSNGVFNPQARNIVEARYLRMDPSDYEKWSPSLKPKSMYLIPDQKSGIQFSPTHYNMDGFQKNRLGDTWILKLDEVEDHTVITIGDSLDRAFIEADLVEDWKSMEVLSDKKMSEKLVADYLLPLDWAKTSIPFYYQEVAKNNKFRFVDPMVYTRNYQKRISEGEVIPTWLSMMENNSYPDFNEDFFRKFPELKKFKDEQLIRPFGNYVEGLHFGELPPSKIKALIYHSTPPSADESKLLKKLGIEVIDGRGQFK